MSLLTSRLISKESHRPAEADREVFWQFDKCTLLSSQGSDAPAISPFGFLFRATSLSYSSCSACQIGAFRLKSKRPTMASHEENLCPADRLSPSRGNLYSLCSALHGVKSRRAPRACRASGLLRLAPEEAGDGVLPADEHLRPALVLAVAVRTAALQRAVLQR